MKENIKKTVFITGASSGIGRETAVRLAKEGCRVFAGVRKKIDKQELEKLSADITGVYIDVTNDSSINKAFLFIIRHTKKLDVLINNAGIVTAGPIEYLPIKSIKEQFAVNTFGPIAVTQKFLPLIGGGKVITVSSMAATGIFPYISPYCASKRAADIMLNALSLENKDNIKFIFVKPAAIKTPIWNKSIQRAKENLSELSDTEKNKYAKEFFAMEKNALKNNDKSLEIYEVVNKIIKIVKMKNPKAAYTIGDAAMYADWIAKLPLGIINSLIKLKLKSL